jgi:hypothetical protein
MTAQPHDPAPAGAPEPAKSLRAIRAAVFVPEDREAFDAGLKAVLDELRANLDLGVLNAFVHRWWISACDSAHNPEGRRQMHARAALIAAGEGSRLGGETVALDPHRGTDQCDPPRERYARSPSCSHCWRPLPGAGNRLTSPTPAARCSHTFGERGLATHLLLEEQHQVPVLRVEWP